MGSSRSGRAAIIIGSLVATAILTWAIFVAFADSANTPQTTFIPASVQAALVRDAYMIIFILAGVVFFAIMAVTLIFTLLYRERPGQTALQFHGNSKLEVVWTLIPVIIVVIMAVPTFSAISETSKAPPADALKVVAIGHQWWFEFQYPELGLTTANELHVPVGRAVSVTLESKDVIHSFWVPQLSGKVDMMPGHRNHLWFTPTQARPEPYLAQCAEFCGISHANMRFRVFVRPAADFDAWTKSTAADRTAPTTDIAKAGEAQFAASGCVGCHTVKGNAAAAGTVGPNLTHFGSRTTLGSGVVDSNPQNIRKWLANPQNVKPGALMPNLNLSQDALDKLVPYLEGLK
ncbi:MAG: cytochrome c oxidase subunit II [Dehalococcoidia bacterium]|nr:cytochrome c oxidase subunit II [Dehalococcoidia bacterium]